MISIQERCSGLNKTLKTNAPTEPDYPKELDQFHEAQEFTMTNSGYKWQSLAKPKRFPLKNDTQCDACVSHDSNPRRQKNLKESMVYLEPKCRHEIHQSCRSRFSRAIWDFGGHSQGYQLKDCPVCFIKLEFVMETIYYAEKEGEAKSDEKLKKVYKCPCAYFLDGNDLNDLKIDRFTKQR